MSSKGNRSHPNQTRIHGNPEGSGHDEAGSARAGSHQESRDHHKHNNAGQAGHKPQHHSPAEQKH